MSVFGKWVTWLFFPNRCCLCGRVITPHQYMCPGCQVDAPFILPPICERCGRGVDDCTCGKKAHAYKRCIAPFYYRDQMKTAIRILKNDGYAATVSGLAFEMAEMIRREYGGILFDCVTPVPLHPKDQRRRGYNQSELLCKELSRLTNIPYAALLKKTTHTSPQKELKASQREVNLLGVFDVASTQIQDKTVLLVDDLFTTGSTLNECAKILKIYGAREVYGITAAATILKKTEE